MRLVVALALSSCSAEPGAESPARADPPGSERAPHGRIERAPCPVCDTTKDFCWAHDSGAPGFPGDAQCYPIRASCLPAGPDLCNCLQSQPPISELGPENAGSPFPGPFRCPCRADAHGQVEVRCIGE